MNQFELLARCFQGLEPVLARELEDLGAENVTIMKRAVAFTGDMKLIYRTNLCLRSALDVNLKLFETRAENEQKYYHVIAGYPWEKVFRKENTLFISVAGTADFSNHSLFLAQKAKDAVVDRLREKTGTRPVIEKGDNCIPLMVYFFQGRVSVWFNTSGEPLFKRGYRDVGSRNRAPLNESLAAGMILMSGWDPTTPFVDLMCGSATLPIEAAMIRHGIKPNQNRQYFPFINLPDFNPTDLEKERNHPLKTYETEEPIHASDLSANNIKKARQNIIEAGLNGKIQTSTRNITDMEAPSETPGTIILNPPYGERMDLDEDIQEIYKQIGAAFKHNFPGYTGWVFTSNLDALKSIGLRPFRRFKLFNGPLECVLFGYKLYAGTKKIHKLNERESN